MCHSYKTLERVEQMHRGTIEDLQRKIRTTQSGQIIGEISAQLMEETRNAS